WSLPGGSKAFDADWMQSQISAELPEFGAAHVESSRVYAAERNGDGWESRNVLRVSGPEAASGQTRILTGRLHASEDLACSDFEAAGRLREAKISKTVWIPRPLARLA